MDFQQVISGATTLTALLAGAGWGIQRGTLSNVRGHRDDLLSQNTSLKEERADLKAQNAELKSTAKALRDTVTGEVHLVALTDLAQHHHEVVEAHWRAEEERWRKLFTELREHGEPE